MSDKTTLTKLHKKYKAMGDRRKKSTLSSSYYYRVSDALKKARDEIESIEWAHRVGILP